MGLPPNSEREQTNGGQIVKTSQRTAGECHKRSHQKQAIACLQMVKNGINRQPVAELLLTGSAYQDKLAVFDK